MLVNRQDHSGEGFAITTVICAYIEALAAFKYGKVYNSRYNDKTDPTYEYRKSRELYVRFLTTDPIFTENFWTVDKQGVRQPNQPFSAVEFYEDVRCALIHEGRTKNNWYINARKRDCQGSLKFIEIKNGKKTLLRSRLHARMLDYLEQYSNLLRAAGADAQIARRLFARKMDHLFEYARDEANFEWWGIGNGD